MQEQPFSCSAIFASMPRALSAGLRPATRPVTERGCNVTDQSAPRDFLPPFHPNEENPTQCLERDLELIAWLDKLGFHEAWIGEHHSAGYEIISSPEIFIAFAAERTRHIRLGTGVVSLPYHHPMMIADRIVQLDHMTRGRVMFGAGPGLLAGDAIMMGIDPMTQRDRMAEALDAILRLFQGEIVTEKTDWYTMEGCRLHLCPTPSPIPRWRWSARTRHRAGGSPASMISA